MKFDPCHEGRSPSYYNLSEVTMGKCGKENVSAFIMSSLVLSYPCKRIMCVVFCNQVTVGMKSVWFPWHFDLHFLSMGRLRSLLS